jgi:hypothetical protein
MMKMKRSMFIRRNLIPMANGMDDDMDDERQKTIDLRDKDANDTGYDDDDSDDSDRESEDDGRR